MPEQHLIDLAVGHFEDQLAKSQAQVRVTYILRVIYIAVDHTAVAYVDMSTRETISSVRAVVLPKGCKAAGRLIIPSALLRSCSPLGVTPLR